MTDFLTKAVGRKGALFHVFDTGHSGSEHQQIQLGADNVVFKKTNAMNLSLNMIDQVYSVTPPINTLSSAGTLTWDIPEGSLGHVQDVTLMLTVTNTHGSANLTLAPAPLWINRVEFYANSGNQLIQQISGLQLFLNTLHLTHEQLTVQHNTLNMTSNYGAAAPLAFGASTTVMIPFYGAFYEQARSFLAPWQGAHTVRVYFSNQFVEASSGAATISDLTLNAASLRFCVRQMPKAKHEQRMLEYRHSVHDFRYLSYAQVVEQKALAASTEYTVNLGAINGLVPWIFFVIRGPTPINAAKLRTFNGNISKFAIYDSSNNNIVGGSDIDFNYARYQLSTHHFRSQGCDVLALGFWSHCTSIPETLALGQNTGYQVYDTNNTLRFTTGAGLSPDTYEVTVLAPVYARMRVNQAGIVEVLNS